MPTIDVDGLPTYYEIEGPDERIGTRTGWPSSMAVPGAVF